MNKLTRTATDWETSRIENDIKLKGSYPNLFGWLLDITSSLKLDGTLLLSTLKLNFASTSSPESSRIVLGTRQVSWI